MGFQQKVIDNHAEKDLVSSCICVVYFDFHITSEKRKKEKPLYFSRNFH